MTSAPAPIPVTLGEDAADWLASHGYPSRTPLVRSSDYRTGLSNPRHYYLTRRLGLRSALSWSKALNRGSWFHKLLELYDKLDRGHLFEKTLAARVQELHAIAKQTGLNAEATLVVIDREIQDARCMQALFEAAGEVRWTDGLSFRGYLTQPHMQPVGRELRLLAQLPAYSSSAPRAKRLTTSVTYDLLMLDVRTHKLEIIDAKTTSLPARARLETVHREFQTRHYLHTLAEAVEDGSLRKLCPDLPSDVRVGSMKHIAVTKPKIELSGADRDFRWQSQGKRTGLGGTIAKSPKGEPGPYRVDFFEEVPVTTDGTPYVITGSFDECFKRLHEMTGKKPEKAYFGEPSVANYQRRVAEWCTGTGHYADESEARKTEPVVNMSTTPLELVDSEEDEREYQDQLAYVCDLASRPPMPGNYLPNIDVVREARGGDSSWLPLYTCPVWQWPEIFNRLNLLVQHEEETQEPEDAP